jgi:RNA polymerase sigma-70 factor (ECF subfamily)
MAFDEQALGQIYDAYFERLYRYAYRFVDDAQVAQDIASETLRRFLETLRDGRAPNHLAAWLYRVAYHLTVDLHRQRLAGQTLSLDPDMDHPDSANTESDTEERLERDRVRTALAQLTPDQQNVVVLKFMEGYSNAEVGALMNKPEGAIKSLQHRALAALRRALAQPVRTT